MSNQGKKIASVALFVLAIISAIYFRFHQIEIKPFHHDEGVNSYFLLNLWKFGNGSYKYDPTNYHGPTLYYFAYFAMWLFGETDLALRFWPAVFGVLAILLLWPLRDRLGLVGTPVAAFLIALSPGLIYFSRDFIHEMSFGCFSLGMVVGAWRYAQTKHFAWLFLLAASTGLLFATKETAVITVAVMITALICASLWEVTRRLIREKRLGFAVILSELMTDWKRCAPTLDHALAALIIFLFINLFFYSSIFTHWQGVRDAVESILLWTRRSRSEHVKGLTYYLWILFKLELPLLIGSLLAGVFAAWRGTRFWLFAGAWTLGMTLSYSLIGYKTPWLMISFLIPLALVSGYAAEQLFRLLPALSLKSLWMGVIVAALLFSARLAWRVNFEKFDDNSNSSGYFTNLGERLKLNAYTDGQHGYVYAQTDRDFLNLVQAIKDEADQQPARNHTGIYIASPDYWPLPWYLRDYDQVAFTGSLNTLPGQKPAIPQPIVLAGVAQQAELDGQPGWQSIQRAFTLRPGVELVIYLHDESQNQ